MYVLMICFIAVVLIIGIFCVVVVARDIVNEERAKKNASEAATATPVVVYQPAPAPSLNSLNFFTIKKTFGLFCYIEEFKNFHK